MDTQILESAKALFFQWMGGNQDAVRAGIVVVIGLLAAGMVLAWVGSMMSGSGVPFFTSLLMSAVSGTLVLVTAAVVKRYLCPHLGFSPPVWIMLAGVLLVYFGVIVPMTGKILAIRYTVSLSALSAAAVALILFTYLASLGYDTFNRGAGDIRARRSMRQAEDRAVSL